MDRILLPTSCALVLAALVGFQTDLQIRLPDAIDGVGENGIQFRMFRVFFVGKNMGRLDPFLASLLGNRNFLHLPEHACPALALLARRQGLGQCQQSRQNNAHACKNGGGIFGVLPSLKRLGRINMQLPILVALVVLLIKGDDLIRNGQKSFAHEGLVLRMLVICQKHGREFQPAIPVILHVSAGRIETRIIFAKTHIPIESPNLSRLGKVHPVVSEISARPFLQ